MVKHKEESSIFVAFCVAKYASQYVNLFITESECKWNMTHKIRQRQNRSFGAVILKTNKPYAVPNIVAEIYYAFLSFLKNETIAFFRSYTTV